MEKGSIIILNGVSSAGKTTLAKVLQERLSHPYFHLDVDTFCLMAPQTFIVNDYSLQHDFASNMYEVAKLFSDKKFNLVITCVFLEGYGFLEKCTELLHDYPVCFVHVTCPIDELQRRELERGNREIGSAEAMLPMLIPKHTYDITVDTYKNSVEKCADKIIEILDNTDNLTALKTLWKQMSSC